MHNESIIEEILERMGWIRRGRDQWEDPTTGKIYGVIDAYEIHLKSVED